MYGKNRTATTMLRRQYPRGDTQAKAAQQDGVKDLHEVVEGRANYEVSCK